MVIDAEVYPGKKGTAKLRGTKHVRGGYMYPIFSLLKRKRKRLLLLP